MACLVVSLDPLMVDGTGMCGGCRVSVGGKSLFACVHGPFFDAHEVDFDEADARLTTCKEQEDLACDLWDWEVSAMPIVYPHKTEMPCRDPEDRRRSWDEVAEGYTVERAIAEARRCLNCQDPVCEQGCPRQRADPRLRAPRRRGGLREGRGDDPPP